MDNDESDSSSDGEGVSIEPATSTHGRKRPREDDDFADTDGDLPAAPPEQADEKKSGIVVQGMSSASLCLCTFSYLFLSQ